MISNYQSWPWGSCRAVLWLTSSEPPQPHWESLINNGMTNQLFVSALFWIRDHKINDQTPKRLNKRLTNVSAFDKRNNAVCHKPPTKVTETLTRGHESFMGWNSIALQTLPFFWGLKSAILFCRLKEAGKNKDDEKRGRRESGKDFSWIRRILWSWMN